MKTERFISEIEQLSSKDFNYRFAYTDRIVGVARNLFGHPLEEVLKTCKVCVSGYFLSLNGFDCTDGILNEYDFTPKQLDAIIYPEARISLKGFEITSPKRNASLEDVIEHIKFLFNNQDFIGGDFKIEEVIKY